MNALIVDDNALFRSILERMLARRGIPARGAGTGHQGMLEIGRTSYALVVLDIHLPDANGIDLLATVRRLSPGSHVVVVSSECTEENARRALAGGAARCFDKSGSASALVAEILAGLPGPARSAQGGEGATRGRTS